MPLIATLISHPDRALLAPSLADKASRALGASAIVWLAEAVACDVALPAGLSADDALASLAAALSGEAIDFAIQDNATRRKKILIADMDSTMIDQECIDELADEIGVKDRVADITARSMNGEIAFEPALRERVALLAGLDAAVIDRIIDTRLTLTSGGKTLVATMKAHGAYTALVSGGFDVFTSRIAAKLGFDENRANHLIEADGKLTGKVSEPILGRAAKAAALNEISTRLSLTPTDAMAVGDGANDLDMIRLAGSGVALHAKPSVAAQAKIRIDNSDLTALLYLQGYSAREFAR
ncbi:phosphoserine phosphatase SerB [Aminobacter sp. MDW-2]|uniref:phosphoserine phosphatase SerB n=1 Tax=Aminobacter sp. MDW-2 TaxID=2666139 RepID=UPI0012B151D7|nr:phosphoserine phosphatase SerB [Aminobacter sp. MDW-2]MRX36067.1 phosphoserine phosphatase SerB [Aminobacter sp. MDW-2]QNH31893.1 phosphoserine phosphatase SerB [Aminobacter sp. MDW-2]